MRLIFFQDKLKREIKELEALIQGDRILSQQVQPIIFCIAALLRKMLERLAINDIYINVVEIERPLNKSRRSKLQNTIKLQHLLNAIMHYVDFRPSYLSSISVWRTRYITILGDKYDKHLRTREVAIKDFIDAAKKIAEDDALIINHLLPRAKQYLKTIVNSDSDDTGLEQKAREVLIDVFDVTTELEEDKLPEGNITVFHEEAREIHIIDTRPEDIEYRVLLRKVDTEWFFIPFTQFQFHPDKKHGKVLEFESYGNNKKGFLMIRAKDLLDVLCAFAN